MNQQINITIPEEKTLTLNDITLSYVEQGTGDAILLLHGWPQTSYVWRKIMPLLSAHYRVIAVDLPGLGKSAVPLSYDTENIAVIIHKFTNSLQIDHFHMVGHDIGGWVATTFALNYGYRLKTLTIIDSGIPGLISPSVFQPENAKIVWQFYFHSVPEMPEFLTEGKERAYISWYFSNKTFVKTAIQEADIEQYYLSYNGKEKMNAGFGYYRAFTQSAAQNNRIISKTKSTLPILGIGGEHALGAQVGHPLQRLSTNVRTEIIADCGHYVPEEQPEKLVELIRDHISIY